MRLSDIPIFGLIPLLIAVICLPIAGYIANIVQLINMANDPISGLFVIKAIGCVVIPLGSICGIVGWF
jgi:hypothetical protein